eukprot:Hpha_TRINITY_DN31094_c0_g1::TRINITY_DN31094_c0_g1_i1::g.64091::m.64091
MRQRARAAAATMRSRSTASRPPVCARRVAWSRIHTSAAVLVGEADARPSPAAARATPVRALLSCPSLPHSSAAATLCRPRPSPTHTSRRARTIPRAAASANPMHARPLTCAGSSREDSAACVAAPTSASVLVRVSPAAASAASTACRPHSADSRRLVCRPVSSSPRSTAALLAAPSRLSSASTAARAAASAATAALRSERVCAHRSSSPHGITAPRSASAASLPRTSSSPRTIAASRTAASSPVKKPRLSSARPRSSSARVSSVAVVLLCTASLHPISHHASSPRARASASCSSSAMPMRWRSAAAVNARPTREVHSVRWHHLWRSAALCCSACVRH